jgi:competence protein ComEA
MNWFKQKLLLFLIVGVVLFIWFFEREKEHSSETKSFNEIVVEPTIDSKSSKTNEATQSLYVDVKGEVMNPGVIEMEGEKRIGDVIEMAGGFTEEAQIDAVNLAQRVHDEMVIYVPKIGSTNMSSGGENGDVLVTSGSDKVRINYAKKEEIEKINGIGSAKASAIIQYREENGYFQTAEDLLKVNGIGEKTLEKIKDSIQIP